MNLQKLRMGFGDADGVAHIADALAAQEVQGNDSPHLTRLAGVVTVADVLRRHRFHPVRAQARASALAPVPVAALMVACVIGCGPIEYIDVSSKAGAALAQAKQVDAERLAPYEYTAAQEYLHKAREEAGYSEYQVSIEFGRKAEELAARARALAQARAREGAAAGAPPPPAPAPAAAPSSPAPATTPAPSRAPGKPGAPAADSETPRR